MSFFPAHPPAKTTEVDVTAASARHTFNTDAYFVEFIADRGGVHIELGNATVEISAYTDDGAIPLTAGVSRGMFLTKPRVLGSTFRHVAVAYRAPAAAKLRIIEYYAADGWSDYGASVPVS